MDSLDITLPAIPSALQVARQALSRFAAGIGMSPERIATLQIATGEALNNVIEHAYGSASGTVRLVAAVKDDVCVVEVHDRGRWRHPGETSKTGRGLKIVHALVDEANIQKSEEGTVVRLWVTLTPMEDRPE